MNRSKKLFLLIILLVGVFVSLTATSWLSAFAASGSSLPWWNDGVCYEVFVRSFYDSNGDGIGDLQGLIDKLDYLNDGNPATNGDLGVTCLWLMPIFPSPSYHGYDVTNYYKINPDYGDITTFKRLLQAAHARGIRVIIDLVLNHTSDQHPWFIDSASGSHSTHRDWYIWSQIDPGYCGPWGEKVWHWRNGAYYYGIFWSGMPDLNYRNNAVTAQMEDVARFWLNMGVDGFRLDAIKYLIEDGEVQKNTDATHVWLKNFRHFYKSIHPNALTVGEVWDEPRVISTYYDDQLDMCFEFTLAQAILSSVNAGDPSYLEKIQSEIGRIYPFQQYATFLTNHDQNRTMTQLHWDWDKAKLAAASLLTLPGVPFIYYGEEIGMTGKKPDEYIRTPMQWTSGPNAGFTNGQPWEPINYDFKTKNVENQLGDSNSLLNHYKKLIHLRIEHPALRVGTQIPVCSGNDKVYAYLRHSVTEDILVILNFSNLAISEYQLALSQSDIPQGTYSPIELLKGDKAAKIDVTASGGFSNYRPILVLSPHAGYVILLQH